MSIINRIDKTTKRALITIYLISFSFFISLMSIQSIFSNLLPGTDSSVFITIAKGMTNGKVPYRDFFDHKGPLLYLLNFIGYSIGGIKGVWLIELISITISVVFLYNAIKILYNRIVALFSVSTGFLFLRQYIEGGNLTEEYALPLICIAIYLFAKIIKYNEISIHKIVFLGFTFGLSLMLRPNMFSIWFIFSAYIVISNFIAKDFLSMIKYIIIFFAGTVIAILPFIIYLIYNNAFNDYIYQNFIFNSQYAKYGLSFFSFIINILKVTYFYPFTGIILCIASCIFFFKQKHKFVFNFLTLLSILLSIIFISVSNSIYGHYYMVLIPLITLSISSLCDLVFSIANLKNIFNKRNLTLLLIVVYIVLGFRNIIGICKQTIDRYYETQVFEMQTFAKQVEKIANKGDTIQVIDNKCSIYLYTDLPIANKYIYDYPIVNISTDVANDFIFEWNNNKPNIVVSKLDFYKKYCEEANKNSFYGWLYLEIENNYEVKFETDDFIVFYKN